MYFYALCIFLLIKPSVSRFAQHSDFQKVGEVIIGHESYKILKPVSHYITDFFKDFMLNRDTSNFPTKRLFIDDNSFRHYWSAFDRKSISLRKTDLLHAPDATEKSPQDLLYGKGVETATTHKDDSNIVPSTNSRVEASRSDTVYPKNILRRDGKAEGKERTVAKTTFFCPYLGVITMSAFID